MPQLFVPRYTDPADRREQLIRTALLNRRRRPDPSALMLVGRFPAFRALDRIALLNEFPTAEEIMRLDSQTVETVIGRRLRKTSWEPDRLMRETLTDERWLVRGDDRHILWIGDAEYPPRLRRIYDAPAILYIHGEANRLRTTKRPSIACVGTRRPEPDGIEAAFRLGKGLALSGADVPSGLARGIDGAAHRGVVRGSNGVARGSQQKGSAIAVLGSGIDTIYPKEHRDLALDIVETGGLIVSEYPPGRAPAKHHFPARNRIVVGMSDAVVLVQAPERSGALISAELAHDIGIDVLVHVAGSGWTGGKELTSMGAPVVGGVEEVLNFVYPGRYRFDACGDDRDEEDAIPADRTHPALSAFGPTSPSESIETYRRDLQGETQLWYR